MTKRGVILTVRRRRRDTPLWWGYWFIGRQRLDRHVFERLTKIRLKPGEARRVRVERVKG